MSAPAAPESSTEHTAVKVAGIASGTLLALIFVPLLLFVIIGIVIWLAVRNRVRNASNNVAPGNPSACPQGYYANGLCACPTGACSGGCGSGQVCIANQCRTPSTGTCPTSNLVPQNGQCVDSCSGAASVPVSARR